MGTAELQRRNYVQRKEARAGATLSRRRGTWSRCGTRPIDRSVGKGAARARGFARVATRGVARSERVARSGATGDRFKEACAINKSLSCLGDVFTALNAKARLPPFGCCTPVSLRGALSARGACSGCHAPRALRDAAVGARCVYCSPEPSL